jgi:uncharacterized protein YabE (DUF348 family)
MKKIIYLSILLLFGIHSFGQMVMSVEGIQPENVCNPNAVFFLMSNKAKPVEPIDSIEVKLNNAIKFVKENTEFEAKPAVQLAINCNGEIGGGFHIVTKSGNEELDKELMEFFKTIKEWKAGKKNKRKTVDSWYMWRLEIKEGYIEILN